jgi:hypothetical protein
MSERDRFLRDEFFSLTLMATVQRADVYSPLAPEAVRKAFRAKLRRLLEKKALVYRSPVYEAAHVENIRWLAEALSKDHASALKDGRLRIGTAQKALNLYLKYLWCLGKIEEPPHCPFDYQMISALKGCSEFRWTTLDSIKDYEKLVAAAKEAAKIAGNLSLGEWELKTYNSARLGSPQQNGCRAA